MGFGIKILKSFRDAAICLALMTGSAIASCAPDSIALRGSWGQARFNIEVADNDAARAQGLMFREKMSFSAGMLFIYPKPQPVSFWMKNTLIPLDMIFIDETGVVASVHEMAVPHDTTAIPGGSGILAVLEINGGLAGSMGIKVGSQAQHPSFAKNNPVWPCEG